jgi:DNA invertase Pin-like site-specific DNA recombinase
VGRRLGTRVDQALPHARIERLPSSSNARESDVSAQPVVAYYRVSTRQQQRSGLGLMAQQDAVQRYVSTCPGKLLAELTEVESGRKSGRPKLKEALWLCRVYGAKLVIARLDRLARSLVETGVEFVAVDMSLANRFTIHIRAAVAEYEARLISERSKAAIAAAKARGRNSATQTPARTDFPTRQGKPGFARFGRKQKQERSTISHCFASYGIVEKQFTGLRFG